MSDTEHGSTWWQASDGNWYPPDMQPAGLGPRQPSWGDTHPGASKTNGLAIASLVLAILYLVGIGSILAIIFGLIARREVKRSGGLESGRGIATAGTLIGAVGLLFTALLIPAGFGSSGRTIVSSREPNVTGILRLGSEATLPQPGEASLRGIASVTVTSLSYVKHTGDLVGPKSGSEYAAANVRMCAGRTGSHSVQSAAGLFGLISATGTLVSSNVVIPGEGRALDEVREIGPGACAQGYVGFEIGRGRS
ncbi:MAG: DUF4190 domain-containing protein [Acidimicrobiales bacterium]